MVERFDTSDVRRQSGPPTRGNAEGFASSDGENTLPAPALPVMYPTVRAPLANGGGACWEVQFATTFRNTDTSVILKQGLAPGKTKIILAGKSADRLLPAFPLAQGPGVDGMARLQRATTSR